MPAPTRLHVNDLLHRTRVFYPGVVITILLAIAAYALSANYGAPVMLFALLLGMAVNFLGEDQRCALGIDFCSKTVLRTGVALLGLRVTAGHLADLGWLPVSIVVAAVILTTALGAWLGRAMKLGGSFGVLTGGSVAICGASAAIAISSVLPDRDKADRQLAFTIIGVTTLSTLAMVIYPAVAGWLGLSDLEAGVFLGGTIHDVAQVVGAGYSVSDRAGDLATIVKLLRVAMLVPMALAIMLMFRQRVANPGDTARFPGFLLVFVALAALSSAEIVPAALIEVGNTLSRACLVVAIAAVGAQTQLREVARLGWRPVIVMLAESLFIAAIVLTAYTVLS
jgi:uncharacterized integral membrane protein (TIGR00698 family)